MQCLHAYFAKALQHPVFRKRKSEGTAGRNRVDPLGEHRESWKVRGVDAVTLILLLQLILSEKKKLKYYVQQIDFISRSSLSIIFSFL